MKKNRIAILIGEIGLVIACAGGFYVFNQQEIKPTEVYTFAKNIQTNTQISASDLQKIIIPAKAVTSDFARKSEDIVGKYVNTKVFAGEYVTSPKLVEKEKIDPFESIDLSKLRKISLPINFIEGLGGNIKRGDKVDLIYTGEGSKASGQGTTESKKFIYSKTRLQDILVYSVTTDEGLLYEDKSDMGAEPGQQGEDIATAGDGGAMSTITLAVTLDQAEEITARMKSGQLRIVGRFDNSTNYDSVGYVVGDYDKVYTGSGLAEVNK